MYCNEGAGRTRKRDRRKRGAFSEGCWEWPYEVIMSSTVDFFITHTLGTLPEPMHY